MTIIITQNVPAKRIAFVANQLPDQPRLISVGEREYDILMRHGRVMFDGGDFMVVGSEGEAIDPGTVLTLEDFAFSAGPVKR